MLHLYKLHVCFSFKSGTFVCVVVHAIETWYPIFVLMIVEHSLSKLKPML